MNAKQITAAILRNIAQTNPTALSPKALEASADSSLYTPKMEVLLDNIIANSHAVWVTRTRRPAGELTLLSQPVHVYREMMVPFTAVCHGLRNQGQDPASLGLPEDFIFAKAVDDFLAAEVREEITVDIEMTERSLAEMAVRLKQIGLSNESDSVTKIKAAIESCREKKMKPLREFVALVGESMDLRKAIAETNFSVKQEDRLVAIATYLRRTYEQYCRDIALLEEAEFKELLKGQDFFQFRATVEEAKRFYETTRKRHEREKVAHEAAEKRKQEEEERQRDAERLETWRKVAKVECRHRYGHENAVLSNDYDPDGHFYAGEEETEWLVWPDHNTGDPGVSAVKHGAHCLCHWHKLDGMYIKRQYSQPQTA